MEGFEVGAGTVSEQYTGFDCDDEEDSTSKVKGEESRALPMPRMVEEQRPVLPMPRLVVEEEKGADRKKEATEREVAPALTGDDLKRARYLQQTLTNMLPAYFSLDRTGMALLTKEQVQERERKHQADSAKLLEEIKKEQEGGVLGPATRQAYQRYVDWLQSAVPATIMELDSLKLQLPAGTPIGLEIDQHGRATDPALYRALASDRRLSLDLAVPTGKLPTDEQLNKLDDTYNWLARSSDAVRSVRQKHQEDVISEVITAQGLPEGWKRRPTDNFDTWVNSAQEVVNLAVRTRNYIEAMQSLFKASRNSDFPLELPRGTTLIVKDYWGKKHEVTEVRSEASRRLFKSGTLLSVKLDLPEDLRQEEPGNKEKLDRMREWLNRFGDKVDQAVGQMKDLQKNRDAVIMFGDQEVANGKAVFNAKGEFVKIVDDRYAAKPGEEIRDFNIAGYNFDVEPIKDGPNVGKYKITQHIQAEKAEWYHYQNIRLGKYGGVQPVGEKMKVDEKIVGPDDFVPVRTGEKIELVMAKNLSSYKRVQQAWYYGEKSLAITMDAAMLVSGTIEIGAAVHGARLAATGTHAALKLTTGGAAWEVGKGVLRVGVAGAGIFNNAGARDSELGRTVNHLRGAYFLGDVGLGLAHTGWNLFRAGKAAEALSTADKVHTIIHGRKAAEGVEALSGIPWVGTAHTGTHWAFKATEAAFIPVIATELGHHVTAIMEAGKRDAARDSILYVGDGRGLVKPEKAAFNAADPRVLEASARHIDGYRDLLCRGRSPEVVAEISSIFNRTRELLAEKSPEKRASFANEMVGKLVFSADEIHQLNQAHPDFSRNPHFQFSPKELAALLDPAKRDSFAPEVVAVATKILQSRNPDVLAAARMALLFVSRDADGKIPADLGVSSATTKPFQRYLSAGRRSYTASVPERTYEQKVSAEMVVRDLRRDLEFIGGSNRGIVTGDLLTRIGALTHREYGGVLQNVLKNANAGREDKLSALSDAIGARMAVIIDGVAREDKAAAAGGKSQTDRSHGLTAEALVRQLEESAASGKDPDVRAMSAALLYGLREPDAARKSQLLTGFNTLLEQHRAKPGSLATAVQTFLKSELAAKIPDKDTALADRVRESKLNAALSLAVISSKTDDAVRKVIDQNLVESFGTEDAAVRARVLAVLVPQRIEQMQKDNPKLVDRLRSDALELVRTPTTREGEAHLLKLLEKMPDLLKDGDSEFKRALQAKLHDMLRNREGNKHYAEHFPRVRAAAIDILAGMGSRESLDIIRSHATASESIKIGGRTIAAAELDAAVRLSAVKALEKLSDPYLRSVVTELVDKERDPAVAARLRDVRFTAERIEPDSRRWKDLYESTRKDLIGFGKKYPYLDDFGKSAAEAWLEREFPLLKKEAYDAAAKAAVDNSTSWLWRRGSHSASIHHEEFKAYQKVYEERMAQWNQLKQMASEGGEAGNKAKLALYYIATQSGSVLGSKTGLDAGAVEGYFDKKHLHKIYEHDWSNLAAKELVRLAESNCDAKDVLARCIKDGLTANKEVPAQISLHMLDAWRALSADPSGSLSREEQAVVTMEALKVELGRLPGLRSPALQKDLIADLHKLGHRIILPGLQAIVDEAKQLTPDVAEAAKHVIDSLQYSIKGLWSQTKEDKVSTADQRSARLQKALEERIDSETTVQEIFGAYKGYKVSDEKDPGLRQLHVAMNDNSERVRLAAAKIVAESDLPVKHPAKLKALSTLIELTFTASTATYHSEAYELLQSIPVPEGKPMHILIGDKFYEVEKKTGLVRATLIQRSPGSETCSPAGYLYPGGESFCWDANAAGELTQVRENGKTWKRASSADGKLSDEWVNAQTGEKWYGRYKLLPGGKYQYQTRGKDIVHVRDANGKWTTAIAAK